MDDKLIRGLRKVILKHEKFQESEKVYNYYVNKRQILLIKRK